MKKFYQICAFITYFLLMATTITYEIKPFHLFIFLLVILTFLILADWDLIFPKKENKNINKENIK